jgi:hypothetical protein
VTAPPDWSDTCGDTDPTPELARIQQIARQLCDPRFGDRRVDTVTNEEYL